MYLIVQEGLELGIGGEAGLAAEFYPTFTLYLLQAVGRPTRLLGLVAGILRRSPVNIGLPARVIEVILMKGQDFVFYVSCLRILVMKHLLLHIV